jgi:acetyl/propionyl-CoA carboxylase alpha subunit
VRVDSAVEEGGEVTPFYDPMIAKLIAHGVDREDAAARLAEACRLVEVYPVKTNAAFLARCAAHPDFVGGAVDTGFIEARLEELTQREFSDAPILAAIGQRLEAFMEADHPKADVWASAPSRLLGFRMSAPRAAMNLPLSVDGKATPLRVALAGGAGDDWSWDITVEDGRPLDDVDVLPGTFGGDPLYVFEGGDVRDFDFAYQGGGTHAAASDGAILSPMPGKIVSVAVEAGQAVVKGLGRAVRRRGGRAVGRRRRPGQRRRGAGEAGAGRLSRPPCPCTSSSSSSVATTSRNWSPGTPRPTVRGSCTPA